MDESVASIRSLWVYGRKRTTEIVENLRKNHLWQRQVKNVAATTILGTALLGKIQSHAISYRFDCIPKSSEALGRAAYLGAITTVFAHPGRRFGQLAEALILALAGTFLGLAWSLLGLYLSSFVVSDNFPAAYSIKGIFLAFALIFHGFLRSKTPRLFVFVLLLIIVSLDTLTSTSTAVTLVSATHILYPILTAGSVVLLVNLFIFPEFSSSFLGETTIDTLHDAAEALQSAGDYFTVPGQIKATHESHLEQNATKAKRDGRTFGQPSRKSVSNGVLHRLWWSGRPSSPDVDKASSNPTISLQDLVGAKTRLRSKLSMCKATQNECVFEVAFAVLPPRELKPISNTSMKKLVANVVAVIGACESKFALLGEGPGPDGSVTTKSVDENRGSSIREHRPLEADKTELELVKPRREIEFGDAMLLQRLLQRITTPYTHLNSIITRAVDCVTICIAYSYDVPKLPSGARVPQGLDIEEVDLCIEEFREALWTFDTEIAAALEGAIESQEIKDQQLDVMPREEIFLVASFVLNLRQAATHVEQMLQTSRSIVLQHQTRHGRRRLYAPKVKWSKWLYTGGEQLEGLSVSSRKRNKSNEREKKNHTTDAATVGSTEHLVRSASAKQDLEQGTKSAQRPSNARPEPETTPVLASDIGNNISLPLRLRARLADGLEWAQRSDDLLYAFKLNVAVFLVTWPAFIADWNQWYSLNRGCE
ncbi:MAG: hypothetical protein Q9205_004141 [Flavoplaca limonia]